MFVWNDVGDVDELYVCSVFSVFSVSKLIGLDTDRALKTFLEFLPIRYAFY